MESNEILDLYPQIELLEIRLGNDLVPLADPEQGGNLFDHINRIRREIAAEMGVILPTIRIRDLSSLNSTLYQIKINEEPVASGKVYPDLFLATDSGNAANQKVVGIETTEPVFGIPALWIDAMVKDQAANFGYVVVDPNSVIAMHLKKVVQENAVNLLTYETTQCLIQELGKTSPTLVEEILRIMTVGQIRQVLRHLLREQGSIRQLRTILEILCDNFDQIRNLTLLSEYTRLKLAEHNKVKKEKKCTA